MQRVNSTHRTNLKGVNFSSSTSLGALKQPRCPWPSNCYMTPSNCSEFPPSPPPPHLPSQLTSVVMWKSVCIQPHHMELSLFCPTNNQTIQTRGYTLFKTTSFPHKVPFSSVNCACISYHNYGELTQPLARSRKKQKHKFSDAYNHTCLFVFLKGGWGCSGWGGCLKRRPVMSRRWSEVSTCLYL